MTSSKAAMSSSVRSGNCLRRRAGSTGRSRPAISVPRPGGGLDPSLVVVLEEPAARLHAEPASPDHLPQQGAWAVLEVAQLVEEMLRPAHHLVQSHAVGEGEGAQGHPVAEAHRRVDVFGGGHSFHDGVHGLVDEGQDHAGGHVTRRLEDLDRGLAEEAHERHRVPERLVGRAQAAHDLDQGDGGAGAHEVQAQDAVRPLRPRRDLAHGEGRGVGGEDVLRRADAVELLEDGGLELEVVGHRLHHDLGGLEGGHGLHGGNAGEDGLLLGFRAPPLRDVVVQALDDLRHGRDRGVRRALAHEDVEPGGRAGHRDPLPHGPGADDADRPHDHGASRNSPPRWPIRRNFS